MLLYHIIEIEEKYFIANYIRSSIALVGCLSMKLTISSASLKRQNYCELRFLIISAIQIHFSIRQLLVLCPVKTIISKMQNIYYLTDMMI